MCTIKYFLTCLLLGSFVMASEQEGIIELSPPKKLTDNKSEFGVMNVSTESDDIKVDDAVHNLLSHKFTLSGEELDKKIKESYDKLSKFENTDIINFLNQEKARNFEDSSSTVTIYLPVTKTNEDIKNALLAAAYFPKELDPDDNTSCCYKHVHDQLIKSSKYDHPASLGILKGIAVSYCVPRDHHFYQKAVRNKEISLNDYEIFCIDTKNQWDNKRQDDLFNVDLNDTEVIEEYFDDLVKMF